MQRIVKEIIIKFIFNENNQDKIYYRYHNCDLDRAKVCAKRHAKTLQEKQKKECTLIEFCYPYRFGVLRATMPYPCRETKD